ncbi:hypothetical protein [Oligosphaera ethanolica]|uniref:Uncharacterized protein n=1 Tax=Oligosphaera ethanolica TaxID=760260 RepID=A0AAE3VJ20_9BACT|nr:hypothetical protein [Oligosphaera ethanolica]MDQ0291300.1 hypothetical protein [Oligosphaera ethanolica]
MSTPGSKKTNYPRIRSVTTPALRRDNLPETHGPPPPSHPTLISADLCGSVFHRSNHPGGESTVDNLQETHGQSPPCHYPWVANQAADFIGVIDNSRDRGDAWDRWD